MTKPAPAELAVRGVGRKTGLRGRCAFSLLSLLPMRLMPDCTGARAR
jgi:hypothetical protein